MNQIRSYIQKNFDADYLPKAPIFYKTKSKNAQEAHEAIRPTDISRTPQSLIGKLSPEQFKLYEMIWKRTVASQMSAYVYDQMTITIGIQHVEQKFIAKAEQMIFDGYKKIYDDISKKENEEND